MWLLLSVSILAQSFDKAKYYQSANGTKGKVLKSELCAIIRSHTARSYDQLWEDFKKTDMRADGKVWDMYSGSTNFRFGTDKAGNYSKEGDKYNREHSFPKSWFNDGKPMYTDLYHLYPTDGYVNGQRSNWCFGEVGTASYTSNGGFSKKGSPTAELRNDGCKESTVFEPNDEYKGDMARTYFYMVTAYQEEMSSWRGCGMIDKSAYPSFTNWAKNLLMKWSKGDKVSEKETDRIEAVYNIQKNRNPFIDFPGLEEYIWGEWKDSTFSVNNYRNPYEYKSNDNGGNTSGNGHDQTDDDDDDDNEDDGDDDGDETGGNDSGNDNQTVYGDYYEKVTEDQKDWSGQYLIVYERSANSLVMNGDLGTDIDANFNTISVTIVDNRIEATATTNAAAFSVKPYDDGYTVSTASGVYIGRAARSNGIDVSESNKAVNKLSVKNGIEGKSGYCLRFNNGSNVMRFRYYSSTSQQPIALYKRVTNTATQVGEKTDEELCTDDAYYDLTGRKYEGHPTKAGIYIHKHKIVVIK